MTDPMLGLHADALALHGRRLELIAGNIANADTPGFQARDIDFQSVLRAAAANQPLPGQARGAMAPGSMAPGTQLPATFETQLRTSSQPTVDGNGVDVAREQAAFADAALHYQASLNFIEGRMRTLLTAVTGE